MPATKQDHYETLGVKRGASEEDIRKILGENALRFYGLDVEKLSHARPDAIVMHPGPMNRGVEIDPAIADGARSVITDQVEMGVAVRMAVLDALLPENPDTDGASR